MSEQLISDDSLARRWIMTYLGYSNKVVPPLIRVMKSFAPPEIYSIDPIHESWSAKILPCDKRIFVGVYWLYEHLPEQYYFGWMEEIMQEESERHRKLLSITTCDKNDTAKAR